jgi:hypothetical protein
MSVLVTVLAGTSTGGSWWPVYGLKLRLSCGSLR